MLLLNFLGTAWAATLEGLAGGAILRRTFFTADSVNFGLMRCHNFPDVIPPTKGDHDEAGPTNVGAGVEAINYLVSKNDQFVRGHSPDCRKYNGAYR